MHVDAAKDNETFVVSNGIGIRIEMRAVEAARIGNEFYCERIFGSLLEDFDTH